MCRRSLGLFVSRYLLSNLGDSAAANPGSSSSGGGGDSMVEEGTEWGFLGAGLTVCFCTMFVCLFV